MYDKKNYAIHVGDLRQALDHGLILVKVHKVIEFSQEAWLKPYRTMNTKLRAKANHDFENNLFKLMNSVFGKTMENVSNHRNIRFVATDRKRSCLVAEPNYHTIKRFL